MKSAEIILETQFCHVFLYLFVRSFLSFPQPERRKNVKQKKEICMLKRGSNFKSHKLFCLRSLCFVFQFVLYSNANSFVSIHNTFFFVVLSINLGTWDGRAKIRGENQWWGSWDNLQASFPAFSRLLEKIRTLMET